MASSFAGAACRASARLVGNRGVYRGFTSSARCLAAQNFSMPALSPTMTEGNIATWKVKEGETYSAGDVLLEIETDKANMDVEAQEDGIVMKIMAQDGAKAIQVGTRIAVLAEAGDDIKTLEIPEDAKPQQSTEASSAPPPAEERGSPESAQDKQSSPKTSTSGSTNNEVHEQRYPLMPSVETLVHQNGLSKDVVSRIKPTGPNGRLLKGDVLAHLGSISADSPAAVSSFFKKLSKLDLSNIKTAVAKPLPVGVDAKAEAEAAEKAAVKAAKTIRTEIHVPVSLAKVVELQERIQRTLGVFMPLSTFISRAAEIANDKLPPTKRKPTANELFDQVLGLNKVKGKGAARSTRGTYVPQLVVVTGSTDHYGRPLRKAKKPDVLDMLISNPKRKSSSSSSSSKAVHLGRAVSKGSSVSSNDARFKLTVPEEDEDRASMCLERFKAVLEEEPERLVVMGEWADVTTEELVDRM
ncbi:hypothetical protein E4U56_007768 [Claviceps arundinis]|uniref:Pyruvate dehydrogenase protein x component n=1 Tax=Claviceps arundinis TaxID=1623583 RepID=A0A9P7MZ41_9HYPO|nr:hypothetical protein E4U56_007768 [Claviceps arundinis]